MHHGTEEGKKATDLLQKLYNILSYGTNYLTFSSWNTFGAIQVSQPDFLKNIIERKLVNGITKEGLEKCIKLLNVEYDPQEYHKSILVAFESCLKTTDARYMAIELLKEQVENPEMIGKQKNSYKENYFVECIVDLYFELCEVEKGIKYFHKQYKEKDKEVKEYILLKQLEEFELYKNWIVEYEKHLEKIDYRDSLKEEYKELKSKTQWKGE